MREVDNKIGFGNVQPQRTEAKGKIDPKAEEANAQPVGEEIPQQQSTKDLNSGAAVGGRSQIPEADAIKKDVNFALKNPEKIKLADDFFEKACASLEKNGKSKEEAYATAAEMQQIFVEEVSNFVAK